jgi:hypothetical protein
MTPARVVWKKSPMFATDKNFIKRMAREFARNSKVRARVVKEVWWRVEYAEKGRP